MSPQHGQKTMRGDALGLTSRHRTARSSCMGRSRHSPYSGTPSCGETAQPLPCSAAPMCSNASLSWASTQRPPPATASPQVPTVGTLAFHPKPTMYINRWDSQGPLSFLWTPIPASSKTAQTPHLSFRTCQLVLGFANSKILLLFFLLLTMEVPGNLWVMDSRLWEELGGEAGVAGFSAPHPQISSPYEGASLGPNSGIKRCGLQPSLHQQPDV